MIVLLMVVFALVFYGLVAFSQADSAKDAASELVILIVKMTAFFLVTFTIGMVLVVTLGMSS